MRRIRCAFVAVSLLAVGAPSAQALDMLHVTCRAFLASGHDNMAAIIMWLRGYHAGKSGLVASTDTAIMRAYGGRLGSFCKQHPEIGVIGASEQILEEEDHGI